MRKKTRNGIKVNLFPHEHNLALAKFHQLDYMVTATAGGYKGMMTVFNLRHRELENLGFELGPPVRVPKCEKRNAGQVCNP